MLPVPVRRHRQRRQPHTATSGNVAKVDYAGAVNATAGLLSHWRLGEASASLITSDHFNGTAASALPGRTDEAGGTWTYFGGANTQVISNDGRTRRNGTGISINYTTTTPSTQDYSVEADLRHMGTLAGDMAGVMGRLNTGTNTYYIARWEEADTSWNLLKVSSGSSSYLNYVDSQGALTVGQHYRIRLEMTGTTTTTLRLLVNGVLKVSYTDTSGITAAGKAGIVDGTTGGTASKSDTAGLHFDNFQVMASTYVRAADSKGSNTADYVSGVVQGVVGALTGDANTAVRLDGVNDHIQATNTTGIPVGATNRSMEGWFKTTSSARQMLFGYGTRSNTQEFGLLLETDGVTLSAWGFGGGNDKLFTAPYVLNDGGWHHVVKTYDGTTITIYVDGVALPTQAATRSTVMNAHGFGIGAVIVSGDSKSYSYFDGSIDEISMYTSVLDQTTVTNHYQLGTALPQPPVVAATGSALAYSEGAVQALDSGITVTDGDSANLVSATVTMTTNYVNGQDVLAFPTRTGSPARGPPPPVSSR